MRVFARQKTLKIRKPKYTTRESPAVGQARKSASKKNKPVFMSNPLKRRSAMPGWEAWRSGLTTAEQQLAIEAGEAISDLLHWKNRDQPRLALPNHSDRNLPTDSRPNIRNEGKALSKTKVFERDAPERLNTPKSGE